MSDKDQMQTNNPLSSGVFRARCVRRQDIERAFSLKPAVFSRLVAKGIMPPRVPGTRLWDRHAIERTLDKLAGLNHSASDNETAADRWFRENADESRT